MEVKVEFWVEVKVEMEGRDRRLRFASLDVFMR